jgi:hypothetical protein
MRLKLRTTNASSVPGLSDAIGELVTGIAVLFYVRLNFVCEFLSESFCFTLSDQFRIA